MNRRQAREIAFQLVYEYGVQSDKPIADLISDTSENQGFEANEYIENVLSGVSANQEDIDKKISECAKAWRLSRISPTSLAIMRLAVCEILYLSTPFGIAINEAIEIAKKFDDERAPKFINGILNAIVEKAGLKTAQKQTKPQDENSQKTDAIEEK